MDYTTFYNLFCLDIRVSLNWRMLKKWNPNFYTQRYRLPDDSCLLWTTWYENEYGDPRLFFHKDSRPVSVHSASNNIKIIHFHNIHSFLHEKFKKHPVPAYKLQNNNILILDGNHRIVSAVIENRQMTINAIIIDGPLHEIILPDLMHWKSNHFSCSVM